MGFLTCRYEIQKAKITIGPLQCQQEDNEPFNVEKEIKTLKENYLELQESDEIINGTIQDMNQEVTNEIKTLKENNLALQENTELINVSLKDFISLSGDSWRWVFTILILTNFRVQELLPRKSPGIPLGNIHVLRNQVKKPQNMIT